MKKLLVLLLACALLFAGCAKKEELQNISNATQGTGPKTQDSKQDTGNGSPATGNATADDLLDKGMDMFDYTVDPLMSDSGYEGEVPR